MKIRLSVLTSAVALAFSVPQANAETPDQAAPATKLPAVNVTAERSGSFKSDVVQVGTFRDMAPLDVPQASNVVTREVLDAQAATTLFGALRNTPGVSRTALNGSTYDNLAVRGILIDNRSSYRLNGALTIVNLVDVPLENKERVEVLKGVSSLYYGFVPPSGIANLVTKRAGKEPLSNLALSANQYGGVNAHVDLGRRFGSQQQFGARVNLVGGREEIGIDNFSGDRSLAAAAFDWRATAALSFKLDLEHYRKESTEQAAIEVPAAIGGIITLPAVPDNRINLGGEWGKYSARATNLLFRADYALNDQWGMFLEAGKSRTSRDRNYSEFRNYNLATGQGDMAVFFSRGQEWNVENYRAEIYGRVPGQWFTHEISFGYTMHKRNQDAFSFPPATVLVGSQNLYNPVSIPAQFPTVAFTSNPSSLDDRGWYLSDRLLIGEKWQAMVGVRGSDYESVTKTTRYQADKVNPALALLYKPVTNVSLYASYLEGLEESGQAPAGRLNAGEVLPPALSKQKEIGVKAQVAQGVLLQVAYFDIKRPSTTTTNNVFALNGLAQFKGLEMAASGEVTKQLSLIASALLLDARQLNATNPATYGKVPDNTPERIGSLFGEYRLPGVPGLALSGGAYYMGQRPVNNENQAFIDSYTTLSLGARYTTRIADKRTTFQAVLDNATDKNYWNTAGSGILGVGAPRTLKVVAKVEF